MYHQPFEILDLQAYISVGFRVCSPFAFSSPELKVQLPYSAIMPHGHNFGKETINFKIIRDCSFFEDVFFTTYIHARNTSFER